MRQRQGALDVVGDRLGGGIGEVVERQDDHVIADADAAVLAAIAHEFEARGFAGERASHGYHLFVFILWMCTCRPLAMLATVRPTSLPYLRTVSPFLMSLSAILCPSGTASSALRRMVSTRCRWGTRSRSRTS